MAVIIILAALMICCFSFVLLFGAPYLPTLKPQAETALDMLDMQPGQTLLELGCGDGRVLIAAARRGLQAIGYELNPILVLVALVRTWRYRQQVQIVWGNYWRKTWPPADGIFGFILPRYMEKLHKKIMQYPHRPVRVASFAFPIRSKTSANTSKGVFLYVY